jgi:hypothetical protein
MAVGKLSLVALTTVAAAVVAGPPAAGAAPACSSAGARAAIAASKPRLALVGPDKVTITPSQADKVLCFDATGDGRADMAVSLFSGGTAGDVGWLFFVPHGARWRLARSGSGYKLGLFRSGSGLLEVQPVYRKDDPNCCPTGGFEQALYEWRGGRLVVERSWHTKTFRPPG